MPPVLLLSANRPRPSRFLFLALTLATAAALPPSADAQSSPPASPGAATQRHADDTVRYRVDVVAPAAIAATFASAIDLIRWQDYAEMTEDLFDRLARDAVPQAKEAAATQGYFSANVEITVDRSTQPVTVKLVVTPNLPTHIANVGIDVAGPANDAPEGKAAIAKLRDEWLLPKGAIFRQEDVDGGQGARGGHARGEPVRGSQADGERGPHRSPRAQRRPRRVDRKRSAVSCRRSRRARTEEVHA